MAWTWASALLIAAMGSPLDQQLEIGPQDGPAVEAWLFRTGCATCQEGADFVQRAAAASGVRLHLRVYRLEAEDNRLRLLKIRQLAGAQEDGILALVIDDRILFGLPQLQSDLPPLLSRLRPRAAAGGPVFRGELISQYDQQTRPPTLEEARQYVGRYDFWAVLAAGLVDGINPCAFSAMALLLSYLAMVGRSRGQLLGIGGIFCATMFGCYLLEGILLGSALGAADLFEPVGKCVRWTIVVVTGAFAVLSIYDAVLAARGRGRDMLLKLPASVQKRLHGVVRSYARTGGLILSTVALAAVIALLETVCTGQLYLPTVQLLVRSGEHGYFWGLLLYNVAFILPLVVLFLLVSLGISSERFSRLYRRAVPALKVAMAAVFVAMTVLLALHAAGRMP